MRIEDLRLERTAAGARAVATVIWEDCDRPTQEIYFETEEEFAQDLSCNPHAFLIACLPLALRHGEARVAIREEICPELRNGLLTAMAFLRAWYGHKPVRLETKEGARLPWPRAQERAGSFLSGGVDSLATLRANRLDYPPNHPRAIKDCLLVHGFDISGRAGLGPEQETFARARASLLPIARDAGVTLIPLSTNIRHLDDELHFWEYEYVGAALAAVAHAFARRLSVVSIASSFDAYHLKPSGTHPLLDPNYSSADLQIRHDNVRFSRLDKVRLLADWDVALQNLRVCTMNPPGKLNCGRCEKCIRTMLELLVVDKLASTEVFPTRDVSAEMVAGIEIRNAMIDSFFRELIGPLQAKGRADLAKVIEEKSAQFHRYQAWVEERDWKGAIKRWDRKYLGSSLFKAYKALRERAKGNATA
jgi:hypothetical protein